MDLYQVVMMHRCSLVLATSTEQATNYARASRGLPSNINPTLIENLTQGRRVLDIPANLHTLVPKQESEQ